MKLLLVFAAVLAVAYGTIITNPVSYGQVGYSGLSSWDGLGSRSWDGLGSRSWVLPVSSQVGLNRGVLNYPSTYSVPYRSVVSSGYGGYGGYGSYGMNLGYGLGGYRTGGLLI